jgi:hypothetical protein
LPFFYAIAVILHGLWNLSVILLVIGGIMSTSQTMPGIILALLGGGLLLICVSLVGVALVATPVVLRRRGKSPQISLPKPVRSASSI